MNFDRCGVIETHYYIIYQYPLVNKVWLTTSHIVEQQIDLRNIVFGVKNNRSLNNLISKVAYSIHKYWVICTNEKKQKTRQNLELVVKSDLRFKSTVMNHLGEIEISTLFQKLSQAM